MKTLALLLLTACYGKSDAVDEAVAAGAHAPVTCVRNSGGSSYGRHYSYQEESFVCRDSVGQVFQCDHDACIELREVK